MNTSVNSILRKGRFLLSIFLLSLTTVAQSQSPDYAAFYPFINALDDSTTTDATFDGVALGAPIQTTDRLGASVAYYFDGSDDGFTIASSLLNAQSNITIAMWIKFTFSGQGSQYRTLVTKTSGSNDQFELKARNNSCVFEAYDGSGGVVATLDMGGSSLSDNNWHHLAVTMSGAGAKMYLDGALEVSTALSGTYLNTSINDVSVAAPTGSDKYFEGSLDELAFYSRALTHKEIIEIGEATTFKSFHTMVSGEVVQASIDSTNHSVSVVVPHPQTTTALTFVLHDGVMSNTGGELTPYTPATFPAPITTTDHDGDAQIWTINAPDYESDIVSFSIPGQLLPSVINTANHTVSLYMPYATDLSSLTPTIGISSSAEIDMASGVGQDFSSDFTYTVTALDGEVQPWTVTVMEHDGTVTSYELGGDATDASIYQNNGIPTGAPAYTTDRIGTATSALSFDGTDDYVSAGLMPELSASLNAFTVNFWMRTNNTTEIDRIFGTISTSNSQNLIAKLNFDGINIVAGELRLDVRDLAGNASRLRINDAALVDGAWHMVSLIFNNAATNDIDIYVDGVENTAGTASGAGASNFGSFDNALFVGALNNQGTPSGLFAGDLDEFVIYNRAITGGEITSLYEADDWNETNILTFDITNQAPSTNIDIDEINHEISVTLDYGTTLATPTFTLSPNATSSPLSGVQRNFSDGEIYTISTKDGQQLEQWTVNVNFALNTATDITSFTISEDVVVGPPVIDATNHTVLMKVFDGADLSSITPTITLSDNATIIPQSGVIQDFNSPITYTITAEDGSMQEWVISAEVNLLSNYVYYLFSGNADDASGNDLHGTSPDGASTPTLTQDRFGVASKAYDFDNDIIELSSDILNGSLQGTLAAWVKFANISGGGSGQKTIIGKGSNTNSQFGLFANNNAFIFEAHNDGTGNFLEIVYNFTNEGMTDYSDGAWHHVAVTFSSTPSSTEAILYVDGVVKGSDSTPQGTYTNTSSNQVTIGDWGSNAEDPFSGAIDEVFISNEVLSITAITELIANEPNILVTEIHPNAEYLEIRNNGTLPVDISEYILCDLNNSILNQQPNISGHTIIKPDSSVLLTTYSKANLESLWDMRSSIAVVSDFSFANQYTLFPDLDAYSTGSGGESIFSIDIDNSWPPSNGIQGFELNGLLANPNDGTNWYVSDIPGAESALTGITRAAVDYISGGCDCIQDLEIKYTGSPYSPNPTPHFESTSISFDLSGGDIKYEGTRDNPIEISVLFDEEVSGFDQSLLDVEGGTITNFTEIATGQEFSFDFAPTNTWFKIDLSSGAMSVASGLPSNGVAIPYFTQFVSTEITSFNLPDAISTTFIDNDKADQDTIKIVMPAGATVNGAVPTFALSHLAEARVGGTEQVSEVTPQNFLETVIYTVRATGGTVSQDWVVLVEVPPTIIAVTPNTAVGDLILIDGTNFSSDSEVLFGGVKASTSYVNNTQLSTNVPLGASYAPVSVRTRGLYGQHSAAFNLTFDSPDLDSLLFDKENVYSQSATPISVKYADFDLDGLNDIVVNTASGLILQRNTTTVASTGSFSFAGFWSVLSGSFKDLAIADLNGDGLFDVVAISEQQIYICINTSSGSGNINFDAPIVLDINTANNAELLAADLNNDGYIDIITHNNSTVTVSQNLGVVAGNPIFAPNVEINPGFLSIESFKIADMDNDGKIDLAVMESGSVFSVSLNISSPSGTIAFANKVGTTISGASPTGQLSIADFDGDNLEDVALMAGDLIQVLPNTSTGAGIVSFGVRIDLSKVSEQVGSIEIGDLDGDGKVDLIASTDLDPNVASYEGALSLYKNTSVSGLISFEPEVLLPRTDFHVRDVAIVDLDNDTRSEIIGVGGTQLLLLTNTKTDKELFSLNIPNQVSSTFKNTVDADIDSVVVVMPYGTSVLALKPNFLVSPGATVSPDTTITRDLAEPVTFTITAEDNTTKEWLVVVEVVANTWDGTFWSESAPPTSTDNAIIAGDYTFSLDGSFVANNLIITSGATLLVDGAGTLDVKGDLTNMGNATIVSGASLMTYSENTISDNIVIQRNTRYDGGKYSFVGSPMTLDGTIQTSILGPIVYSYDETQPYGANEGLARWISQNASNVITPAKGYAQANRKIVEFVGEPNDGTVTISGTYSGTPNDAINDANEGWNLVANPYSAAINTGAFLTENDNIVGAVYIWDDNGSDNERGDNSDYIVANGMTVINTTDAGGQTRYNQHLGSVQGFFVKLLGDTDTEIAFTELMRISGFNGDDNFFRKSTEETPIARLNLRDAKGLFKQTVIGFVGDIDDAEMNRLYDAPMFDPSIENGIYTIKQETSLAIQGVSRSKEVISLGYNLAESGQYEIQLNTEEFDGKDLFLFDELTKELINLSIESYMFESQAGVFQNRFMLLTTQDVLAVEHAKNLIYVYNNILYMRLADEEPNRILIHDLQGHLVFKERLEHSAEVDLNYLSSGVYIIKNDEGLTQKIIIK